MRKENAKNGSMDGAEVGEDSTKYGEFITTYFAWLPLPEQKEKVERLQNITKKKDKKSEKVKKQ